eukprot:GFUD01122390.1.p1 GENE.GFUD01122390.1~~GFUD01122390.1.p1  ORF type:complete len:168 (+),score=29.36 GFUD01122390.1:49-552(+)
MPSLQKYVLEPVATGGFDEETFADILTVLETVLLPLGDPYKDPFDVRIKIMRKIRECLGGVGFGVAGRVAGKNFLISIRQVGARGFPFNFAPRLWCMIRDGVKKGNLEEVQKYIQSVPNTFMIVMAKIQGVRSLQDLAAYQVACSHGTNLERLPIPKKIKEVVSKFN